MLSIWHCTPGDDDSCVCVSLLVGRSEWVDVVFCMCDRLLLLVFFRFLRPGRTVMAGLIGKCAIFVIDFACVYKIYKLQALHSDGINWNRRFGCVKWPLTIPTCPSVS